MVIPGEMGVKCIQLRNVWCVLVVLCAGFVALIYSVGSGRFFAEAAPNRSGEDISVAATDWPWWRGPNRNGIAAADQKPPLQWSDSKNVLWKSSVPGRGHGSPTVVGDQVFLATADHDAKVQSVLCFDRNSGKRLWKTDVHKGSFNKQGNKKTTLASSTVACDGQRLFINFLSGDAVYTTALDRSGKKLWQTKITDYTVHQGFGSSPAVYQSLVLVSADNKGGGVIAAMERTTGKIVWKHDRPKTPNYTSPIVLPVDGRDQLLFTGCNLVSSYEPLTGKSNWEIKGSTTECVTSIVSDGELVFSSGGYPKNHMSAVKADGSGKIVWANNVRVYVPSMLVEDGYIYAVTDAGVANCWKSSTGEEVWKGRLGGTFTASPVLVDEHIFATNEAGKTYIFKADPKVFNLVTTNELGNQVFATPTFCASRIYMRVVDLGKAGRQEMLYCLAENAD